MEVCPERREETGSEEKQKKEMLRGERVLRIRWRDETCLLALPYRRHWTKMDIIMGAIRKKLDFSEFTYMLMEKKQRAMLEWQKKEVRSGLMEHIPRRQEGDSSSADTQVTEGSSLPNISPYFHLWQRRLTQNHIQRWLLCHGTNRLPWLCIPAFLCVPAC